MIALITRLFGLICVLGMLQNATADHALLSDGRILYNVIVPDGTTTGGKLVRMRTGPSSFGYDPRGDTIYSVPNFSVTGRVADYVSTTTQVGRQQAKNIFFREQWHEFRPPPARPRLVMPSPAPKATPTPITMASAAAREAPPNVVPEGVPLQERLDRQLQIFIDEQTKLSQDTATSVVQGLITEEQSRAVKINLLVRQQSVLQRYFPVSQDTVKLAIEYWVEQVERARQTGRFDLESL